MGKERVVFILAGINTDNQMYVGKQTKDMVRCEVSHQFYLVRSDNAEFIFRAEYSEQLKENQCAFSPIHRSLLKIGADDVVSILPTDIYEYKPILSLTLELKTNEHTDINLEYFASLFRDAFSGLTVTEKFLLVLPYKDVTLVCRISNFLFDKGLSSVHGVLMGTTTLNWKDNPNVNVKVTDKTQPLFRSVADLQQMGIGGLSEQFATIFRRLFASRRLPAHLIKEMSIKHVRGMIIHGPPGCGKTLLARQIGQLLNCRDTKIVNGPELLNMYVGESEANTRKLFAEAIGDKDCRELHLIICDEFDALSRTRGTSLNNSPVLDNVVNTLLSYIDGVNQLNNILLICMTNRIDLVDPALLRPGRLELHVEISLPDTHGRSEILQIHTSSMQTHGYIDSSVNFDLLSEKTKNFTGAEIEGLVKSASSYAIDRSLHDQKQTKPCVTMDDFTHAFTEITPMFGRISNEIMESAKKPLIFWSEDQKHLYQNILDHVGHLNLGHSTLIVMDGPSYIGKTFTSAHLIKDLNPNYARIVSPTALIGKSDLEKIHLIHEIFDNASKSEFSVILIDTFERLIEWCPIGSLLNNQILQTLLTMMRRQIKLTCKSAVIMTCYDFDLLKKLEIDGLFDLHVTFPHLVDAEAAKLFSYQTTDPKTELSVILHGGADSSEKNEVVSSVVLPPSPSTTKPMTDTILMELKSNLPNVKTQPQPKPLPQPIHK